jgi:hypothetical protein
MRAALRRLPGNLAAGRRSNRSPRLLATVRASELRCFRPSRPDTLLVRLDAPVSAPLAIWIVSGGVALEEVRSAVAAAAALWQQWGVQLSAAAADFHDVSNDSSARALRGVLPPCGGGAAVGIAEGRINVYVVDGIAGYAGYSCDGYVMISRARMDGRLWAHEIGHQFGLSHAASTDNLMFPSGGGARLVEGQAFRVHVHTGSVLNTVFQAMPSTSRRDCNALVRYAVPLAITRCLPEDFRFDQ